MPALRQNGDRVSAGSLNLSTSIKLQVTRVAAESFIARMARLVEEAQDRKAPIQSMADRVATIFVRRHCRAAWLWLDFLRDMLRSS